MAVIVRELQGDKSAFHHTVRVGGIRDHLAGCDGKTDRYVLADDGLSRAVVLSAGRPGGCGRQVTGVRWAQSLWQRGAAGRRCARS